MKFSRPNSDLFVPDAKVAGAEALRRTTHLCIAAHPDDIEIMAYHGVSACFGRSDRHFTGVTVTNGSGSSRTGPYQAFSADEMEAVRAQEQRKAAFVGDYSAQIQLGYPSAAVKERTNAALQSDLALILHSMRPEVVYLHQPADKHDTHLAVLAHSLAALRALPAADRPRRVYGCEAWRDLDWMADEDKQLLDVGSTPHLAAALVGVFDSQISGGKRYDLAAAGRRLANATYFNAHAPDGPNGVSWAMDLTPLIQDASLSVRRYTELFVEKFRNDVDRRLSQYF